MKRQRTHRRIRNRRAGRETVVELLRQPMVWTVLSLTVAGQVGARAASGGLERADGPLKLPAVVVMAKEGQTVTSAWRVKALERESEGVVAALRADGYSIPETLEKAILEAAAENEIEPEVAYGLVRAESSFENSATSHVGAVGLTQLMPATAAWMEPGTTRRELRDPETNLRIGFKYLRYLMDKYEGDTRLALLAYNRGPGTVDRLLRRGRNPDNGYVEMVLGD